MLTVDHSNGDLKIQENKGNLAIQEKAGELDPEHSRCALEDWRDIFPTGK